MDPVSMSGTLSALTAAGPLAIVLGFAVGTLWRKLDALQRCKSPETAPCGVCMLCDRRISRAEHASSVERLIAAHTAECVLMGEAVTALGERVATQESTHQMAMESERNKRDSLQAEIMTLLNSMGGA